jgi:arginyl-tRNA synthetase
MTKKELKEKLNKYPDNIEIYVYDSDGDTLPLNYIKEDISYHGSKYKGKESKIIILKSK